MPEIAAARDETREAHRKLALVEALAGVGHWRYDIAAHKTTWSPEVYRIHGASPEELNPSDVSVVDLLVPEDRPVLLALVTRAVTTGEGYEARLRLNRLSDRALRTVVVKAEVERDETGAPTALFGVFQDVTDQERALRDAESAVRAKLNFLAHVSHELRTPLTSIMGYARLLEQSDLPEDAHRGAARIAAAGETLLAIVNDLLDLAAMDASSLRLRMEKVRVRDLVQSALDLVEHEAAAKNLLLAMKIAPDAPDWVMGDGGRLRQVLLNLVANAVKFTETGAVRVSVEPAGRALRFSVIDTGPGLDEERCRRVFARMGEADPEISARAGGARLGLAISKRLVTLMGGAIGVDSIPGKGATFWFIVPLSPADAAQAPAPAARCALDILLIEDHAAIQDIVRAMLAPLGHSIEVAADGPSAVAAAALRAYDLIITDANIPALTGPDAVRAIRSAGANRRTPIIGMSAYADARCDADFRRAGADEFIPKPIVVRDLLAAIARLAPAPREPESLADADWRLARA